MQWDFVSSCRVHKGFPAALPWCHYSVCDVHRVTLPCSYSVLPKETAHLSLRGLLWKETSLSREVDSILALSPCQHSHWEPGTQECSDIIRLEIFTAQQAQKLSIIASGTRKVYDQGTDTPVPMRLNKKYKRVGISQTATQAKLAFTKGI